MMWNCHPLFFLHLGQNYAKLFICVSWSSCKIQKGKSKIGVKSLYEVISIWKEKHVIWWATGRQNKIHILCKTVKSIDIISLRDGITERHFRRCCLLRHYLQQNILSSFAYNQPVCAIPRWKVLSNSFLYWHSFMSPSSASLQRRLECE